jgi:DNA-binding beta-propeller fold protein YncE
MRAHLFAGAAALATLFACTGGSSLETAPPVPISRDVLVLDTTQGSVVLDTDAGSVLANDPGAVVDPAGTRLYAATTGEGFTTVETRDALDGRLLSSATFPGRLDVRVASLSGHAVAMMAPLAENGDPWVPMARSRSRIVVGDPGVPGRAHTYRLRGNYEPEAFSIDDARLFLIQYLPAENPSAYRVTFLDLATGRVNPVFGRFKTQPERMPGDRLSQVFDATTSQLYTLYTNHSKAYGGGYWNADDGSELTFVHVLNLREGWAYCAGLPRSLWDHPASAEAMTPSPDGRTLYIVDSVRGVIAEMDTRTLKIVGTSHVDLGSGAGAVTSAVTSSDGATLFVSSSADPEALYAVDAETLAITARWPIGSPVSDVGLSIDGARLYAALTDHIVVLDPATGSELAFLPVPGVSSILNVETPGP